MYVHAHSYMWPCVVVYVLVVVYVRWYVVESPPGSVRLGKEGQDALRFSACTAARRGDVNRCWRHVILFIVTCWDDCLSIIDINKANHLTKLFVFLRKLSQLNGERTLSNVARKIPSETLAFPWNWRWPTIGRSWPTIGGYAKKRSKFAPQVDHQ
jgi:hypothetical protein